MNPETEELEENFHIWPIGTSKEDIWHWFDKISKERHHTRYFNDE